MESIWHILSVVASACMSACLAGVAWLAKSFLSLRDQVIRQQVLMDERKVTLDEVKRCQERDAQRLTTLEGAIDGMKHSLEDMKAANERRHEELAKKLDCLPSINTHLEVLHRMAATIVPREVWESHLNSQNDRLHTLERLVGRDHS